MLPEEVHLFNYGGSGDDAIGVVEYLCLTRSFIVSRDSFLDYVASFDKRFVGINFNPTISNKTKRSYSSGMNSTLALNIFFLVLSSTTSTT